MTLLLEEVEKAIDMALSSHSEEVQNYLEHVNSIMIPPPKGSRLFPAQNDQEAMTLAKGVCAAQVIMARIKGEEFDPSKSWLMMFVAGYIYERYDIHKFVDMDPVSKDWAKDGCLDLSGPVCTKVQEVLTEKMPTLNGGGMSPADLGIVASWVAGRRIGRYVADGEEAAAIFAASIGEGSDG